ncbi:hypothetical protein Tco_0366123 [Tanacetum coccineum]
MPRTYRRLMSTWMAFGGNTCEMSSIWEETGQDYNSTPKSKKKMLTNYGDGVRIIGDAVRFQRNGVRILETLSELQCDGVTWRVFWFELKQEIFFFYGFKTIKLSTFFIVYLRIGLPPDVYAIVNHHKVSKEIWDRVKLLMQGTKLSLQEKEYKYKRNMLIRSDELYKFSDGTLTSIRSVLYDIASNLRMDYLPKKRWSNLDRQRSRIMIKAINKLQLERRLMRSLEKFVGGRDYGDNIRLLEQTI